MKDDKINDSHWKLGLLIHFLDRIDILMINYKNYEDLNFNCWRNKLFNGEDIDAFIYQ